MRFFKSLFTEHLLAKLFAIVFAAVTVYLVDRELRIQWYDQPIVVVDVPLEDQGENPQPYIYLKKDPGVWVDRKGLETIRLKISGSDKGLATFLKDPEITLQVRESWTRKDRAETAEHTLTDSDFEIQSVQGVEITVEPNVKLKVDRMMERSRVPLELDLSDVVKPEGMTYLPKKNWIDPPHVRLIGPRHLVKDLGGSDPERSKLRVRPNVAELSADVDGLYDASMQRGYSDNGVQLLDVSRIRVRVGFEPANQLELKLPRKVVTLALDYSSYEVLKRNEVDFSIETIQMQKAWVYLKGPAFIVREYLADQEKLAKLAASLRVVIDPSKVIDEMAFGDAPPTHLVPQLVVLGGELPERLELDRIEPAEISISALKKN